MVASGTDTLHAAAFGIPEDAWAACADISADTHITYLERPVKRVLSIMPTKYEDIWTAAKGFYKLEPIVADGGEVIIYAPHITQISVMHPHIAEIGYHNRDYFLGQWEQFRPAVGRPRPLHPPARAGQLGPRTRRTQLGHRHPGHRHPRGHRPSGQPAYMGRATVDIAAYEADPDTFVEPHAGEILYRLGAAGARQGSGEPDGRGIDLAGPGGLTGGW